MTEDYSLPNAPMQAPEKKRNTTLIIVIVVLLILLCCCAFVLVMYFWVGDLLIEMLEEAGVYGLFSLLAA